MKTVLAHDLLVHESSAIYVEVFNVYVQVASINRIPKPKPKIQKATKNESESNEHTTDNSDSTSTDSSSKSDESANPSKGESEEKVVEQPESHDEL